MNDMLEDNNPQKNKNLTLIDITLSIVKNLKKIFKITLVFACIGIIYAVFSPKEYSSTSIVINDSQNLKNMSLAGGLSALRRFGINLGDQGEGLSVDTFPEIIRSKDVLYYVSHDSFFFSDISARMTLVEYLNQKDIINHIFDNTVGLISAIWKNNANEDTIINKTYNGLKEVLILNKEEYEAYKILKNEMISVTTDFETGMIKVSVTTQDPFLSAKINSSILNNFIKRMQEIYTFKTSEELKFIQERFNEAKRDLNEAENQLINFVEKNKDIGIIKLQTEYERLKRNVTFKTEIYSELQINLSQTEIELKKNEPIIRIISKPSVPLEASSTGRSLIIIMWIILGIITGFIFHFFSIYMTEIKKDSENEEKISEIKKSIYTLKKSIKINLFSNR